MVKVELPLKLSARRNLAERDRLLASTGVCVEGVAGSDSVAGEEGSAAGGSASISFDCPSGERTCGACSCCCSVEVGAGGGGTEGVTDGVEETVSS